MAGHCRGKSFTCPTSESCVHSSTCNGDDCNKVYRQPTYRCYSNQDACDWDDQYCRGNESICPQSKIKPITGSKIALGSVFILNYTTPGTTLLPSVVEESGKSYLVTTETRGVKALFNNFTVPCGQVAYNWHLVDEDINTGNRKYISQRFVWDSDNPQEVSVWGLTLRNGATYRVLVRASNVRLDFVDAQSDLILVDVTPPAFSGKILDGNQEADIQYQKTNSSLMAHWNHSDFRDPESGIDAFSYKVAAGTKPRDTDGCPYKRAQRDSGLLTGLSLRDNTVYYISVSVSNRAGLSIVTTSDGVKIDTTPPVTGNVEIKDEANQTIYFTTKCMKTIRATIANLKDDESGISFYHWKLCKTPVRSPLQISCSKQSHEGVVCPSTLDNNPCRLEVVVKNEMLLNGCLISGYTYQLFIHVRNKAGGTTDQSSNKLTVDRSPPVAGIVNDGFSEDVDFQSDNRTLQATWHGFVDHESGIQRLRISVWERDRSEEVIRNFGDVPASGKWTSKTLYLTAGTRYYIRITCYNGAGLYSEKSSDGVLIDPFPPVSRKIWDVSADQEGWDYLGESDYQASTSSIKTIWNSFRCISGLESCRWSLSSRPHLRHLGDVAKERVLSTVTRIYQLEIKLQRDVKYYAGVRCTSKSGLTSTVAFTDGITAGVAPPGRVTDLCTDECGSLDDIDYSFDTKSLRFTFFGFNDRRSDVIGYEWNYAVCSAGFYEKASFTSVTASTVISGKLILKHNAHYCVSVRASYSDGHDTVSTSDGVLIDTSPPVGGDVRDGSLVNEDIDYQLSARILSLTWDKISDSESGIQSLEVAFGTQPGRDDVIESRSISASSTSHKHGDLVLRNGRVSYGTVCAMNRARIKTCLHSDGVLIDSTAPVKGAVTEEAVPGIDDQPGDSATWYRPIDVDLFRLNQACAVKWTNFTDHESGIYICMAGIHSGDGGLLWNITVASSGNGNVSAASILWEHGKYYYSAVECYNRVGLQAVAKSDGFKVDGTPPVASAVHLDISDAQSLGAEIVGSWQGCYDIESGIEYFKWSLFNATGKELEPITAFEKTSVATVRRNLPLIKGCQYKLAVIVMNYVGLSTSISSPKVVFDITTVHSNN